MSQERPEAVADIPSPASAGEGGPLASRERWVRAHWFIVLLVLVYAIAFQGSRGLYSPDEGRYTNVALNMLDSGDWLKPMLHPEVEHWSKPPLTYWAIATSVAVLGRNEFAARLPGALAFAATVLLMMRFGRRFVPMQPWLPALTYATFAFPPLASNLVTTDTLLTLWETLQAVAFVELWYAATPRDERRARLLLWLAAGLAFMTKGPPGLLLLGASALFAFLSARGAGLRKLFAWDALLVFFVVGGTWYVVVALREPGVVRYFLVEEVVNRVASDKMHRNAEWYGALKIYVPTVVFGMLPWLPLLVRTWWRERGRLTQDLRTNADTRLLACWLLLPLAVFVLARSRLPLYLLPLFVPLAVIAARALAPLDLGRVGARIALAAWCVVLVLARAAPAFVDVAVDDKALAAALTKELPAQPNEVAFVESDPRYGLRFYLGSEIERLEFPGGAPKRQAQDIASEMREREGCRVLLVNDWNWPRLADVLAQHDVTYKRLADVRGYAVIAQSTPDCPAYGAL
jgi:4-amino-4-deoxy-L-arabinose transferase-like glycosyltransferase